MDRDESLAKSMKTTLLVGAFLFSLLAQQMPYRVAWGFFSGVLFSVLHFTLLSLFFEKFFSPLPRSSISKKILLGCAFLKWPLFYGLIGFLFSLGLSVYAFMIGFSLPFLVLLLKAWGGSPWNILYGRRTGIVRTT